jgi:hypothetical protein
MRDLTEDLEAVPWEKLQDAYGPSGKTPGYLRKLASGVEDERQEAYDELTSTIWHQGSVYEASLHAIPPLAALLRRKDLPDPALVLELLYLLGTGSGWHTAHQGLALVERAFPAEKRGAEIRKESEIAVEIRGALARYADLFCSLLEAPGELTRMRAATLLRLFADRADAVRKVVEQDPSPRVRANALIVLGDQVKEQVGPIAKDVFLGAGDPLLKTSAAIRWGWHGKRPPTEVLEWLATVESGADYDELPAAHDFWFEAANLFAMGGAAVSLRMLPRYIDVVRKRRYAEGAASGLLMVALLHDEKPFDPKTAVLSSEQKRSVLTVAECAWPQANSTYANMCHVLRRFGLPDTQDAMDRLLGLPNAEHPGFAGPARKAVEEYRAKLRPWWKFW